MAVVNNESVTVIVKKNPSKSKSKTVSTKDASYRGKVLLQRLYKDAPTDRNGEVPNNIKQMNMHADAVMHAASKHQETSSYCLTSECEWLISVENTDIPLGDNISLKVLAIKRGRATIFNILSVDLEVSSKTQSAAHIQKALHDDFVAYNQLQLTSSPCIFEQKERQSTDVRGCPYEDPVAKKRF